MACFACFTQLHMTPSANNQPEQQDRDRARRLMEGFDPGASPEEADDVLLHYLDAYKKSASLVVSETPSEAIWTSISDLIDADSESGKITKLPVLSVFWKAAAVVLAASLLVLAYISLQTPDPELLASSGAQRTTTELFDGSVVTLRPNSSLYALEETNTKQTYRIDGEAYFEVAKNRDRLFTAMSGDAKVVVTGTEFSLSNWSDAVRVYLESGSVRFSDLDDSQTVELEPGEYSEKIGDQITEPAAIEERTYTGWLVNELRLDSRTVPDVAAEIEHHFDIRLEIPKSLENERLTGSLQLENREQVLSDLALSLNGRFVRADENRYTFEPLTQD
jgi:ferric-dicitrate binding protein FerR (iron transport regulator)